jgi:hypothetical protein
VDTLLRDLKSDFALKDFGPPSYFLDIEVTQAVNVICLSQLKYTTDLLKCAGMLSCKPTVTPPSSTGKYWLMRGKYSHQKMQLGIGVLSEHCNILR